MPRTRKSSTPVDSSPHGLREIVQRIAAGDPRGMEALYSIFSRGVRFYLFRQAGPDAQDLVHEIFLAVVRAIQSGAVREPERLMGFIRTILRRHVATYIDKNVRDRTRVSLDDSMVDPSRSPEEFAAEQEQVEHLAEFLSQIPHRDREILSRFYIQEQPKEQICGEMKLTETQFRLLKWRAKARFENMLITAEPGRAPKRKSRASGDKPTRRKPPSSRNASA